MDSVSTFVIKEQNKLSRDTEIIIKIGRFVDQNITDLRFREGGINDLLDAMKSSNNFDRLHHIENRKIYRYLDMSYVVTRHGESCLSHNTLASETHQVNNLCLVSSLVETKTNPIETFPTKMEYHDVVNQTTYYFKYDDQIELRLTCEKGNLPSFWKVDVVILKENIYKDRLAKNLQLVIDLLDNNLTGE
jgi:hypothetical protein